MKLVFIGSGSAFTVGEENFQSNVLLENDEKELLLIDCGVDARNALYALGLTYQDIHDVYISHLHGDHVGGLEWLGFTRKFATNCVKPNLYIHQSMVKDIWNNVLSGGLRSIQGEKVNLRTYFNLHPIKKDTFVWKGLKFTLVETIHFFNNTKKAPSFGLMFSADNIKVLFTSDTQFCPDELMNYYKKADIIFQDCETAFTKSGVHAHYNELKTLDQNIKEKMWLYHYNPGIRPEAVKDGFRGFVKRGQCYDFKKPETLWHIQS